MTKLETQLVTSLKMIQDYLNQPQMFREIQRATVNSYIAEVMKLVEKMEKDDSNKDEKSIRTLHEVLHEGASFKRKPVVEVTPDNSDGSWFV